MQPKWLNGFHAMAASKSDSRTVVIDYGYFHWCDGDELTACFEAHVRNLRSGSVLNFSVSLDFCVVECVLRFVVMRVFRWFRCWCAIGLRFGFQGCLGDALMFPVVC